jgi:hypothetical protein
MVCWFLSDTSQSILKFAELEDPENGFDDQFGYSVTVSGNIVVVGAPQFAGGTGVAYVFVANGNGWVQAAKLTDGGNGEEFGNAVAASGNTVVVGGIGSNAFAGAAYVFVRPAGGYDPDGVAHGSWRAEVRWLGRGRQ